MLKLIAIGLISFAGFAAAAEPEIKGTAPELAQFLNGIPKIVAVAGEAEVRVPAHRAVLTLRIITENRSLQEALRLNLELRGKLAEQLKKQGIAGDRIQSSRFSSTPKFGLFSEKAKGYRVENMIRVAVLDEKEFQSAAGAVDLWSEVQFGGVEFEYTDRESLKHNAISQACDNANERRKIYEEKFGLKLAPTRFNTGDVTPMEMGPTEYDASSAAKRPVRERVPSSLYASAEVESTVSSFGELVYTAKITVECAVQAK